MERLRQGPAPYAEKAGALAGKGEELVSEVFAVQQRNLAATESASHAAVGARRARGDQRPRGGGKPAARTGAYAP
ncbi:hypothetical protein [Janthinobacterium psychrotolerans]|uniref:hypothetical protein n=1 Tax=Janthinobacterium psychrotolerans TaxID=1747903 RepID=UPI0008067695|nr:hypothetical protein [Janthinobacterium psychrotolerans]